jgi:stress responsive alpha/beta barrel protein
MRIHCTRAARALAAVAVSFGLFASGYVAGQNRFGQPKTIIHVVEIKWNPGVSQADRQQVLAGIKDMAGKIPGIKNVWMETDRVEPRDFNSAYAIEFQNRAAADAYAESPIHQAWVNKYVPLRAASVSIQVSNP